MQSYRAYTDGRYGQIHYQVWGEGTPLVLAHQSPTNMVQFDPVYPLLANAGFQVIGIDMPGYGGSTGPAEVPTMTDYAHIVPAVLDALGIEKAHICGHHTGALLATEAVLNWPERFDKLILNGPLPLAPEERAFFKQHLAAEREFLIPKEDGSHLVDAWNFRIAAQPGWSNLEAINKHVVEALAAGPNGYFAHDAVMDYDHGAALPLIQHNCLIFSNTGDSIHAIAERTCGMRPDFAFAALEGGTFDIIDEQPEAWAEVVAGWLKGQELSTIQGLILEPAPVAEPVG